MKSKDQKETTFSEKSNPPKATPEGKLPFSESLIWELQQDYYHSVGIGAWQSGAVPHYVTSNPVVGKTYAELVLSLLRDLSVKGQQSETLYILELGAGHGRLCYHFLKYFERYYDSSAFKLPPICYVLSDFTESNLEFWKTHPRFQPYIERGWLDFAFFNVETYKEIQLQRSGQLLKKASLGQPVVVIANYLFDTLRQELFRVQGGKVEQALLEVLAAPDPSVNTVKLAYSYEEVSSPIYEGEPQLNSLLHFYQEHLSDSHLLFPHIGIRCLERLRALSETGLVLLSADRGGHHLSQLDHLPAPRLSPHGGCFSLNVNYHALKLYCEYENGLSLFPKQAHNSLDLGCLLLLKEASSYQETIHAYNKFVQDFGPDDYFSLKKLFEKKFGSLSYQEIMAITRLSGYDARIFQQMLPDLFSQLETISDHERWNLLLIIPRIWDTYFPLREAEDLAVNLGNLLMHLRFYEEAILYFEKSIVIYGKTEHVVYKIALCYCLLGNIDTAIPLIAELYEVHPEHEEVIALMEEFGINI